MTTLSLRRPPVLYAMRRMNAMSVYVPYLKPASMQQFGQVADALWAYLDLVRQADVNQPVDDQLVLAGIEAAARNMSRICLRYYLNATGGRDLEMTQDARAALNQMIAYDVRFAPTFDVENTVMRMLRGTKVL